MTRDDIYDHLAQVYLGKRKVEDEKKRKFNAWLLINIVITGIIFASASYGLTAFLKQKRAVLEKSIIFSLHKGPVRVEYNFVDAVVPVKTFSLSVPQMDVSKYKKIDFSIRGKEEGIPGVVKVVVKNDRNETAFCYVEDVGLTWQEHSINLSEFETITDWSSLIDISFVLESWNVDKKKGIVLIDDIRFSS